MANWAAIEQDLDALLAAEGYELIELVPVTGRGASLTLLADRADKPGITLDECAELSQKVGQYLDVADPFRGHYCLMVSSPGLDRPLVRRAHFERAVGQRVRVKHSGAGRTATVVGKLSGVEAQGLVVEVDGEPLAIAWEAVLKANVEYDWGD